MYQVRRETGPFNECQLVDTAAATVVKIAPERGGIVFQFDVGGRALLYLDEESFHDPARSVRGGIPVLFPICGNLPDDTYPVEGRPYHLRQHGFARALPWQVVEESTAGAAALTLQLTSDDYTRGFYPFDFELRFTYSLHDNELTIQQEYCNRSEAPMPLYAGFHPYFKVSDKSQLQFQLPAAHYTDHVIGADGTWRSFPFEEPTIDWIFTDVNAQTAVVTNPVDGYRLSLQYDPVFAYLVFWTLKDKDFFCLEPWMAPRNAMNTGDHLQHIAPGQCLRAQFSLRGELL